MRKILLLVVIGVILMVTISSVAEYKGYQVTQGDVDGAWTVYPLDAHNVIVVVRPVWKNPWHVSWYRDGELFRDLTGPTNDPVTDSPLIPYPESWDGEHLTMCYNVVSEEAESMEEDSGTRRTDRQNAQTYTALWTGNGLEQPSVFTEPRIGTYQCGRVAVYRDDDGMKIRCDGRETVIPEGVVGDQESIQNCIPLGKDVYLLRIMNPDIPEFRAVCVDHGEEEYRIWLAPQVYFQAPDGNGGFFCPDDWPEGDYSPEILRHYGTDGQIDRSLEIGGNKVVIRFFGSTVDPDNRLCTLYGSAVANSRKVYTVFALTLDENMNMRSLDVRKIDPAYRDYSPDVYLAQDGTAYVLINDMKNKPTLRPVLIPFSQMEKSRDDYGIYVSVIR